MIDRKATITNYGPNDFGDQLCFFITFFEFIFINNESWIKDDRKHIPLVH